MTSGGIRCYRRKEVVYLCIFVNVCFIVLYIQFSTLIVLIKYTVNSILGNLFLTNLSTFLGEFLIVNF